MDQLQSIVENMAITSTPDGKLKRSQITPANFETPAKQNMSATNVFIDGSLEEQRKAVQEDLGPIPEVTVDFMLKHIVPNSNVDIECTIAKLKDNGALTKFTKGYSWKAFDGKSPLELFKDKKPDTDSEAKIFSKLKEIYGSIISCAQFRDHTVRTPTLVFEQNPNHAPSSNSSIRTRPDGYGVLKESKTIPGKRSKLSQRDGEYTLHSENRLSKQPVLEDPEAAQWFNIVCVEEYKIKGSTKDRDDNVLKILWSLHHIMNVDHRRRFTFGITIENKDTRIWFACRQIVFVTRAFDINVDPSQLVRLIASLAFATPTQLGYDPTMTLHWDRIEDYYYYYIECTTERPDGSQRCLMYRTNGLISDSAFNLRGRATRVYDVTLILNHKNGSTIPSGPSLVLKDFWVDVNRTKEGDTLRQLLTNASQDDKNRFLFILQHGPVQVDGQDDSTDSVMLKGQKIEFPDERWLTLQNSQFTHSSDAMEENTVRLFYLSISENPTKFKSESKSKAKINSKTKSSKPGSSKHATLMAVKGGLKHNTHKEIKRPVEYSPKIHYRVVSVSDGGVSLERFLDRGEATIQTVHKAIQDVTKALQFMAKEGYVHRDVSIGNILWDPNAGRAKLIDLEFAKPYSTEASSIVRTGTYAFMPGEVMKRKYSVSEYARRNADVPLIYHPIHDLESLWWVGLFCLISYHPAPYDTTTIKLPSDESRVFRTYRDFNDRELEPLIQFLPEQQRLFPSLYNPATYDLRMEEIHYGKISKNLSFHAGVQVLASCLQNIRKCISTAYEEIQRELPRTEHGYFTKVLRIPDPTTARINNETPAENFLKPVHDVILGILDTLQQTAGTQDLILWRISSSSEARSEWIAIQETKARLRPRTKAYVSINPDLGEVLEECC